MSDNDSSSGSGSEPAAKRARTSDEGDAVPVAVSSSAADGVDPAAAAAPVKKRMSNRQRKKMRAEKANVRRSQRDPLTHEDVAQWLSPEHFTNTDFDAFYKHHFPLFIEKIHCSSDPNSEAVVQHQPVPAGFAPPVTNPALKAAVRGTGSASVEEVPRGADPEWYNDELRQQWKAVHDALHRPLPTTFRLTPLTPRFDHLLGQLTSGSLWLKDDVDDGKIPVPGFGYKRLLHQHELKVREAEAAAAASAAGGEVSLPDASSKSDTGRQQLTTGRNVSLAEFEAKLVEAGIPLNRVPPPQRLDYFRYPLRGASPQLISEDGLEVWQSSMNKREIRDSPRFKTFQTWLVGETNGGNISRQEAVSMIPPVFLKVNPGHLVLDMCAAPGSKTVQIVERLDPGQRADSLPTGAVIANDADTKRCYMLTHQTQRLNTPCFLVTNHEAQAFPAIRGKNRSDRIYFDRVLADVPCTGDGTLRKNPSIWKTFSPRGAFNLHPLQVSILLRGFNLLKPGGRLVYSTCSLNPIEDEAVLAEALRTWNTQEGWLQRDQVDSRARRDESIPSVRSSVSLVDVKDEYPLLKRAQGISSWSVMDHHETWFNSWEDVLAESERHAAKQKAPFDAPIPSNETKAQKNRRKRKNRQEKVPLSRRIRASMFPPTKEEAEWMHLERSMRVLPDFQDTGGFFIAVFEKSLNSEVTADDDEDAVDETRSLPAVPTAEAFTDKWRYKSEAPWVPVMEHPEPRGYLENIVKVYGLSDDFPLDLCYSRSTVANKISVVAPSVRDLLQRDWCRGVDHARLLTVNTGVTVFVRQDKTRLDLDCPYRIAQSGLPWVFPYLEKGSGQRLIHIDIEDFDVLIKAPPGNHTQYKELSEPMRLRCADFEKTPGCVILVIKKSEAAGAWGGSPISAWLGQNTMHLLLSKEERDLMYNVRPLEENEE